MNLHPPTTKIDLLLHNEYFCSWFFCKVYFFHVENISDAKYQCCTFYGVTWLVLVHILKLFLALCFYGLCCLYGSCLLVYIKFLALLLVMTNNDISIFFVKSYATILNFFYNIALLILLHALVIWEVVNRLDNSGHLMLIAWFAMQIMSKVCCVTMDWTSNL